MRSKERWREREGGGRGAVRIENKCERHESGGEQYLLLGSFEMYI
uniref:Uncharacterized protein n=1 Tax=Nelumbo nucifera TaxID=4432 RepID=A0A822XJD1_NELNU|nr:TPA_asm: hypothetical protein HUJ06_020348 [Nelumbo nucifera]